MYSHCLCALGLIVPHIVAYPILQSLEPASEDCLFLDIQVPGKAVRGEVKNLPVLFWLFGGGYGWLPILLRLVTRKEEITNDFSVLGSKSFLLYDGSPFLKSSGNNLIYVAPNYRVNKYYSTAIVRSQT